MMQVVFHLGAHATDEDRLIKSLLRDGDALSQADIAVPAPNRYRMVLRDALLALQGRPADAALQETILDAATDQDQLRRIVFSHEFFLGIPSRVITPRGFYAQAPDKIAPLANLFPEAEVEFHLALVNPAVLIPGLIARIEGADYHSTMAGQDPLSLRWAPVVRRMIEPAGGRRFVIWCHEDTPLIWPEVLRAVSGLTGAKALAGDLAILSTILPSRALERLRGFLANRRPQSVAQRRRIYAAFLEKFALPDRIEIETPLPGWTEDLVARITAQYDADVAEIAALPGVEFIAP